MLHYRTVNDGNFSMNFVGKSHALVHSLMFVTTRALFFLSRHLWLQMDLQLNHLCGVSDSAHCNIATRYQEQQGIDGPFSSVLLQG